MNKNSRLTKTEEFGFALSINNSTIYFDSYEDDCGRHYKLFNKGILVARIRYIILFDELIELLKKEDKEVPREIK